MITKKEALKHLRSVFECQIDQQLRNDQAVMTVPALLSGDQETMDNIIRSYQDNGWAVCGSNEKYCNGGYVSLVFS